MEELSEKAYARANAMLFWAYYFGYEDYPSDLQKSLEYVKKGSDAADPICGLLYAAYSNISQDEKLELLRKVRAQVRKMADANDSLARLILGVCYFHDQQYEDAQKYLDQYEKAGGVLAYEMLGLMQQYIQKNGKAALTYYEKAAKNKFYHAYANIAYVAVENVKVLGKVATGELTIREGFEKMQETTASTIAGLSSMKTGAEIGAAVGLAFGPVGAAVGGFVGGTVAYMAGSKVGELAVKGAQKVFEAGKTVVKKVAQKAADIGSRVLEHVGNLVSNVAGFFGL